MSLSLSLEPKGEEWTAEKYVARRRNRNWIQLETIGEVGSGPEGLAE